MSLTVPEFLHTHGSYIVHQIALAARSHSEHDRAPVVFTALLDRVDDPQMYEHVRHIVEDLLQALDRFRQVGRARLSRRYCNYFLLRRTAF